MKVTPRDTTGPLTFGQLPGEIRGICVLLRDGLLDLLADNLYGIYVYGAMVFLETRYVQDLDFHVIVKNGLSPHDKAEILKLHDRMTAAHPEFSEELDGWYILLDDARRISPPRHRIRTELADGWWPLHVAHMRASYCITLYGPEPVTFLPEPDWDDMARGLEVAFEHTVPHMKIDPAYCILTFCRLLYSYETGDVVISKRRAGIWATERYPEWERLIGSALRVYEREGSASDKKRIASGIKGFYRFLLDNR